jgi:predicted DNA-binding transcriptional regulator AlpA
MDRLLKAREVADLLGVSEATIRHWRTRGQGPRPIKVGKQYRYEQPVVEAWLAAYQNQNGEAAERDQA